MKLRRRSSPEHDVMIRKANNGYVVHLPEQEYYGPLPMDRDDARDKILNPKFLYDMGQAFFAAKEGQAFEDIQFKYSVPEPTLQEPEEPEYENTMHVFPTWQEASDFIKDFYEKQ